MILNDGVTETGIEWDESVWGVGLIEAVALPKR